MRRAGTWIGITAMLMVSPPAEASPPCFDDLGNPCEQAPAPPKKSSKKPKSKLKKPPATCPTPSVGDVAHGWRLPPENRSDDRLPADFTGVIKGITFDTDKDTIRAYSRPTLDNAVKVLKDFPDIRIEVAGHTDDIGGFADNLDLSKRRAEAVKKYLVDNGIDASRIETAGFGECNPVEMIGEKDSNSTKKKKRANNRRIEVKILTAD